MPVPQPPISSIILAGGEGKRAGDRDKGLIELDGKPLVEHVIERIRPQADEILISANRNREQYRTYTSRVFADDHADYLGPLAGMAACLPHCRHEWALVVACDMPNLPRGLVARLWEARGDSAAVAEVRGRRQLALLLHRRLTGLLEEQLAARQLRLMEFLDGQSAGVVDFSDAADAFSNLNTGRQL